ncbi:MAG: hypothetical protein KDD64_14840 [Bdellovibrionales bacterium]|nr:hypothetical protein [Bdellovibrionales bacterium]
MSVVSGAAVESQAGLEVRPSESGEISQLSTLSNDNELSDFQRELAAEGTEDSMLGLLDESVADATASQASTEPEADSIQAAQTEVREAIESGDLDAAISRLDQFATEHEGSELADQARELKENLEAQQQREQANSVRGTEEDPRVVAMREEQERLEGEIERLERLNGGSRRQIDSWKEDKSHMGLIDRIAGTTGTLQGQIDSEKREIERRDDQIAELRERLDHQEELIDGLKTAEDQGRDLEQQAREAQEAGDAAHAEALLAQAQAQYNTAQQQFEVFSETAGERAVLFSDQYRAEQQKAIESYGDIVKGIETTETVLRTTQKVAIIAGATIATGGTFAVVGGGFLAASGAAVAVGTAYGTVVGGAAAFTEAGGHIAYGNKTVDEALGDAVDQTADYAKESAIAAVGTVAGVGVGGKVASVVAGKGGSVVRTIVAGAANGATAGGASAVVSTAAGVTEEYIAASNEFNELYKNSDLSPEELAQEREKFFAQRGLDLEGIAARVGKDVAIGVLGGAVGGSMAAGREGLAGIKALASEVGENAADAGIGIGVAAIEGDLSTENITSNIAGAVIGTVTGRVSHEVHSRKQQSSVNDGPVPLRTYPDDTSGVSLDRSTIPVDVDAKIVIADPSTIRTSQTGVDGSSTDRLVQNMKEKGFVAGGERSAIDNAIDIVEMPDGAYSSMDNRRILAAEEAGVPVVARKREYNEDLSGKERKKFQKMAETIRDPQRRQELIESGNFQVKVGEDGRTKLVPLTWGAALELRVATNDQVDFVQQSPYGSVEERPERRGSAR